MNRKFSEKLKAAWSKRLLDLLEMLPEFKGGTIARLQDIRRRSREHSRMELQREALPIGTYLMLSHLTFVRSYQAEDMSRLSRDIEKAFGGSNFSFDRETIQNITDSAKSLWGGSWTNLGMISRKKNSFSPFRHKYMPTLPEEIQHIQVQVFKVLPSLHVVAFRAKLADLAQKQFRGIYERNHLAMIEFKRWIPFGRKDWMRAEGSASSARKAAVYSFLSRIELETDRCLETQFRSSRLTKGFKYPVIRELCVEREASAQIFEDEHRWPRFLGLDSYSHDRFSGGDYRFLFDDDEEERLGSGTVLVDRGNRPESLDGTDECRDDDIIRSLVPFIAIRHLLLSFVERLGNEKNAIYERALHRHWSRRFSRDLRLLDRIEIAKFVAERLRVEIEMSEGYLIHLGSSLRSLKAKQKPEVELYGTFVESFKYLGNMASKHYELVSSLTQATVQRKNLGLTYRLSLQIWILSAAALTVAVFSNLKDFHQNHLILRQFLSDLSRHIHR